MVAMRGQVMRGEGVVLTLCMNNTWQWEIHR